MGLTTPIPEGGTLRWVALFGRRGTELRAVSYQRFQHGGERSGEDEGIGPHPGLGHMTTST